MFAQCAGWKTAAVVAATRALTTLNTLCFDRNNSAEEFGTKGMFHNVMFRCQPAIPSRHTPDQVEATLDGLITDDDGDDIQFRWFTAACGHPHKALTWDENPQI